MKRIYLILCFALVLSVDKTLAQSDSLSLFRNNTETSKQSIHTKNNTLFLNLTTLLRGGVALGYERYFEFTGLAVYAHAGYSGRDYTGHYSIKDGGSIFYNMETNKGSNNPGYLYEIGSKYYFKKQTEGTYIASAFSQVKNVVERVLTDQFIPSNFDADFYLLKYKSNEIKLMLGWATYDDVIYNDFNFGLGYRFLKYDQVKFTPIADILPSNNYKTPKSYSRALIKESKPWFFITYKFGIRF